MQQGRLTCFLSAPHGHVSLIVIAISILDMTALYFRVELKIEV